MNGDEKEEANRPRPLSGGIWTLFSWLRRSERSSSSESLSSVGSARTAVSFDFLTPGHCNFTNTSIVVTAPVSPPTETYKKRLQDRNLRRQRDRDITLHRKYGLFREYGNGYDGFSLPPTRRALENTVDRQHRERRATSEFLQRRAAYVPGKRRAPLPPISLTSASLPRSYKRKRPAPKPPVKSTIKENINHQINHSEGMNSNLGSDGTLTSENELLMNNKSKKCDKKGTIPKDTKSKSDKSFLKHIFENRKRNSVIETTSVRLLPSISELDKQAAEIIENNKLRRNNFLLDDTLNKEKDSGTPLDGTGSGAWFCTSCLKKYNSSVKSCNYCSNEEISGIKNKEKYITKSFSPRSSIYTQTNAVETASSSQSTDERKILKDILKEMKDSLPKKHKDDNLKVNNLVTETPTLRIGSKVPETYKDVTPLSSIGIHPNNMAKETETKTESTPPNRIRYISSLLPETNLIQKGRNSNDNEYVSGTKSSDHLMKNIIHHKVTVSYENHENKSNISSASQQHSVKMQDEASSSKDQPKEKIKIDKNSTDTTHEKSAGILIDDKKGTTDENTHVINSNNSKYRNNNESQLLSFSGKTNGSKETSNNSMVTSNTSSAIVNQRENCIINQIHQKTASNRQNEISSTSAKKNELSVSENNPPLSSKLHFPNFPIANSVVVNSVTVLTSHPNEKLPETSKELLAKNAENNSAHQSSSKMSKDAQSTCFKSSLQSSTDPPRKPMNNQTEVNSTISLDPSIIAVKSETNLHIPLKISSLLNPSYSSKLPTIKENKSTGSNNNKQPQHEVQTDSNAVKHIVIERTDNKQLVQEIICQPMITDSSENVGNGLIKTLQTKEAVRMEPMIISETPKLVLNEQKVFPSTSGCSGVTKVPNTDIDKLDQYDRRRHLIRQLEQSIANGDEAAAADAAVKLAKLRLSCSILSFSSQIVGESSNQNKILNEIPKTQSQTKQPSDQSTLGPLPLKEEVKNVATKITKENETVNKDKKLVPKESNNKLNAIHGSNIKVNKEPSSSTQAMTDDIVPIDVWVEDKQAARGPIRLRISRRATMGDLRRQAEHSFGLATRLQRWIVGRNLCTDDSTTVVSLAGTDLRAPFYLCLVQSETSDTAENEGINDKEGDKKNRNGEFYTELMLLEQQALVPNIEPFECGVCMEECAAGTGVVLRECIHTFCRECLSDVVQHCQEPTVSCPAMGCSGLLQEREIRTIVSPEEHERWLARSLATAECGTRNTFHCRTRDCTGWAFCDPGVRRFPCPVCKHTNCVQCQAIHEGETCEQYQTKLRETVTAAETHKDDEGTQALLNSLISRGEALECPECKAIITKKWGCDWVKCSACKTEICWITKGRRWGPGGRGDTSAGCRCGVDGQRCHPSCGYCH